MALRSLAALITIATVAHAERAPATLATQSVQLPNGLAVVLAPDATASSVVVRVRYGDGSASEGLTQAGFTHLVERLMFSGSVHVKAGEYDARIEAAGGFTGSVTGADHLSVYEQVPAGALELALFLEAERMAGLADGITDAGLAAARDAIGGEIRAAYVDQPYATVAREVQRALWPAGHRYRRDVLGDGRAVPAATLDDVRPFVRSRIRPGNATLVIAGKLDVATTTALARRYFGWIPDERVTSPAADAVEPLEAPVKVGVTDANSKVVVAYRLPAPHDADFGVVEVVARMLSSQLQSLVADGRATAIDRHIVRHHDAGELHITAVPGRATAAELGEAVLREVAGLSDDVIERSLASAVIAYETDLLIALEGLVYRTDAIARSETGVPERLRRLSPRMVRTVIQRWLGPAAHVLVVATAERP